MDICFISYAYPGKHNTGDFAFVKQLVDAIASVGHHCYVISPYNLFHYKKLIPVKEDYKVGQGEVSVYRPKYVSIGNIRIGKKYLSLWLHKKATKCAFQMLDKVPDVIYGHFWDSAYEGYDYAKRNKVPLFVATGESEITFENDNHETKEFCNYLSGVICVSTKNLNESIDKTLTTKEKCVVLPNAIDASLFRLMDRDECRKRLNFPHDAFIIAFVGWFDERKGAERLSEAIKKVGDGKTVYSLFIGDGPKELRCNNILFKGRLPHNQVPEYLNAADIFVLPTLQEGCCNAVIEAMACGLPIVSSNLPFNWDVLDETNSIMVDPKDTDEIAKAIQTLRDNKGIRSNLSKGALQTADSLTIDRRAMNIIKFIRERTNK